MGVEHVRRRMCGGGACEEGDVWGVEHVRRGMCGDGACEEGDEITHTLTTPIFGGRREAEGEISVLWGGRGRVSDHGVPYEHI